MTNLLKKCRLAPLLGLAGLLLSAGCISALGEPCAVDSDCKPGFVCSLDGECSTFEGVQSSFVVEVDVTVITLDSLNGDSGGGNDTDAGPDGGCVTPVGSWTCGDTPTKKVVALYEIASEGHGAAGLSGAAGLVLGPGFEDGSIYTEVWVDGTLSDACQPRLGWVRGDKDIENCAPKYVDKVPFEIPGLVELFIYNYTFTPSTGVLSGLVDKEEILASLDPALRSAFEPMVQENVDTDGDGIPDLSTFVMTVTFK